MNKDDPQQLLTTPGETNNLVTKMLRSTFKAWGNVFHHLVSDHLPGGTYETMDKTIMQKTMSVKKHNKLCEETLCHLDRLDSMQDHVKSLLTYEAHIIFSKNKVGDWLRSKPEEEHVKILQHSQKRAQEIKSEEATRKEVIVSQKRMKLSETAARISAAHHKQFEQKKTLTTSMLYVENSFASWHGASEHYKYWRQA